MNNLPVKKRLLIDRILSFRTAFVSPFILVEYDGLSQSPSLFVQETIQRAQKAEFQIYCFPTNSQVKVAKELTKNDLDSLTAGKRLVYIDSLFILQTQDHIISLILKILAKNCMVLVCFDLNTNTTSSIPDLHSSLKYIATSVITISSLEHELTNFRAQQKSRISPILQDAAIEGVVASLGCNSANLFCKVELRRKSGNPEFESVVLKSGSFLPKSDISESNIEIDQPITKILPETSINFELSDQQKKARDQVELPHYKKQAQHSSEIIYVPGAEDDFDDEDVDDDLLI